MADKIVIEAEVKSNVGAVGKDAASAAGEFRIMGVSLNSVKAGFAKIIPTAKAMFGTIKAGIMSTGIGALLIAVTALITYFTSTKEGADKLSRAFTAIGATIDVLKDRLSDVGEAFSLVFQGKWKQAADKLKESVSGIVEEVIKEVKIMDALEVRLHRLRDAELEFSIQKAKTRQEIEKARLIAEDETKSAQERLENLKKALELEAETTLQEIALAKEKVAIQDEQMLTSKNLVEDEAKLAQLRVELIEKETASIKMRRRVVTEVNALEREIHAEEKARAKEKQDLIDAENKRIKDAATKAGEDKNKADKKAREDELAAMNKLIKETEEANQKAADKQIALDKLVETEKQKTIRMGFDVLGVLAGKSDAAAKAVAVAKTIYNTQQAIMNTMANVPAPFNLLQSIATGVMGASAVQKILSTSPESASAGGGAAAVSSGTPAPEMLSGAFTLGGGEAPEPMQAYVVSDDITNNQNKLAIIRRRATI